MVSLTVSNTYTGLSAYGIGNIASCGNRMGADTISVADQKKSTDTVELSDDGRLKVSELLNELILPTEENVRKLSATLSRDLGSFLSSLGISADPPLEFTVDSSGEIQLKGDRTDKESILEAINANEKIADEIRTTAAIAGHAAGMAESMKFQREYGSSSNPASVVAKYSYLFGSTQLSHQITLTYDGSGVDVLTDGKTWLSSGA